MTKWLLLAAAICSEVTGSLSLKGALNHPALYAVGTDRLREAVGHERLQVVGAERRQRQGDEHGQRDQLHHHQHRIIGSIPALVPVPGVIYLHILQIVHPADDRTPVRVCLKSRCHHLFIQ